MNQDRFEQSADMRLVELRREQLGIPKPPPSAWNSRPASDLPFGPVPEPPAMEAGPVLTLQTTATPQTGLIAGAVVTLGVSILNEGSKPAHGATLRLPLPGAMAYRPGSLQIDGRAAGDDAAEKLLGTGLDLGALAGAQRMTVLLKLTVKAGLEDAVVSPSLASSDAAVVGAKPLRLERSSSPKTAFAAKVERADVPREQPIYDLEPEETIVYEATDAALGPIIPPSAVRPPPAAPLIAARPVTAPKAPGPLIDPDAPAPPLVAPPAPPAAQPAPAPPVAPAAPASAPEPRVSPGWAASVPARSPEPTLATMLEKTKIATLGQFFSATRSFGMVAHYLLLSSLACSRTLPLDESDDAVAAFFGAQDTLLTKALIAKRLGKSVALGDVAAPLPPFPPAFPAESPLPEPAGKTGTVLYRVFTASELDFAGRAVGNKDSPPFTRAGQLSVALCARRVLTADGARADACERALADYAAAASSEINRLFVRARLNRGADLFGSSSAEFDQRARSVLGELAALNA